MAWRSERKAEKLCRVVKPEPSVSSLKIVPVPPDEPPIAAVPYSVSPDKNKVHKGSAPSLFVEEKMLGSVDDTLKLYIVVNVCAPIGPT